MQIKPLQFDSSENQLINEAINWLPSYYGFQFLDAGTVAGYAADQCAVGKLNEQAISMSVLEAMYQELRMEQIENVEDPSESDKIFTKNQYHEFISTHSAADEDGGRLTGILDVKLKKMLRI